MLLSELIDAPGLGLRLVYAAPGGLDRPVGRVVTIDLLEPGRFLSGGELVLSGLVWRRTPDDSERFVASVAASGVSAVLAGMALLGAIPDDLVAACRRHEVSLVEVPADVPFVDVTEYVAAAVAGRGGPSISLARQRELLSAIASGRTLDELADRVSAEIGHDTRILTPLGRHVVPGPGRLDDAALDSVTRAFLTADRLPAVVEAAGAGTAYSVFPVGPGLGSRITAWLLVAEGEHTRWSRDQLDALHELRAIAALDRSRREEGLRALRPIAEDALALVESGAPHPEVAGRLRQAGLDPGRPVVVGVASADGRSSVEDTIAVVEDLALAFGPPVLASGRHGEVVALLPATPGLAEKVRAALDRLASGLPRDGAFSIGLSRESGVEALSGALDEARFALRAARAAGTPVSVVGSDDVTSHVVLLATVPDDVRRTFAQRVLGPVVEHDRRTGGELVATLSTFLACSCSWARTAAELHLHVNTVRYRIERVEALTGRDLSRLEDRVDALLALKSL